MFILVKNWLKYRKKKYYFHNYIFCEFEIVVCFAPLLHGVEKNTFLNFDSINDSLKSKTWNSWKRMHCNEEARRIRGNGTSCSCMQEWRGNKNGNVPRLRSLPASHRQAGWEWETLRRFQIWDHCSMLCTSYVSNQFRICQPNQVIFEIGSFKNCSKMQNI